MSSRSAGRIHGPCRWRRGGETDTAIIWASRNAAFESEAAFYARRTATPDPRLARDAELTEQITVIHATSRGTYGAPRVHAALRRNGAACGRRRVARLMRAAGLTGQHRKRRRLTTIPDPRAATRPDLIVRDFQSDLTGLDVRWCGDIT